MFRLVTAATLLVASFASSAFAQDVKFPYEATISTDNVYVRSGPGRKYYHTNKLSRGERVVVRRHDPGGWYMIEPPQNAFSWIRADYVKKIGQNRGRVTENDVVVWVGSEFGQDHDVTQQKLSINDQVEILGEQTIQTPDKSVRMYKIAPPRYENRWILGKYVLPKDAAARRHRDLDPYAIPTNAQTPKTSDTYEGLGHGRHHHDDDFDDDADDASNEALPTDNGKAVHHRGPSEDRAAAERRRLERLDDEFRQIVSRETRHWDLARLEDDYRDLQDDVSRPAMRKQIALRLDAVERYQKIKAEYDEFIELTSRTERRDRWLLAAQHGNPHHPWPNRNGRIPPGGHPPTLANSSSDSIATLPPMTIPTRGSEPEAPRPDNISYRPDEDGKPSSGSDEPIRFDGAGIIQRAPGNAPGAARHVLVTPRGQMLAYLQSDAGINLDAYVGRSMGVYGKRWHRPDLRTDFIIVREVAPVKLIP
ncbi:MAG: hypothetical protein WD648_08225 [Planctomycetaceae bacterium]